MYKANLNFDRFHKYFYDLVRKGLIAEVVESNSNGRRVYKITKQGKTLLEVLKEAREIASGKELLILTAFSNVFVLILGLSCTLLQGCVFC